MDREVLGFKLRCTFKLPSQVPALSEAQRGHWKTAGEEKEHRLESDEPQWAPGLAQPGGQRCQPPLTWGQLAGQEGTEEMREKIREELGLSRARARPLSLLPQ